MCVVKSISPQTNAAREAGQVTKAVLVYQAGIANVFAVDCFNLAPFGREARRLMQGTFGSCAMFSKGLAAAGVRVRTMACNEAGDITESRWSEDLDAQPFSDKFIVVDSSESERGRPFDSAS